MKTVVVLLCVVAAATASSLGFFPLPRADGEARATSAQGQSSNFLGTHSSAFAGVSGKWPHYCVVYNAICCNVIYSTAIPIYFMHETLHWGEDARALS